MFFEYDSQKYFCNKYFRHVEDSNLLSINILHHGQPKFWYGVPRKEASKLESLSKEATNQYMCKLLIRHKLLLIPPSVLKQNGIKFGKVIPNLSHY